MDTHLLEKTREKAAGNNMLQEKPQSPVTASPPSASSSPSHEFSFTVSLHHSSSTSIPDHSKNNNKAKTPPSFAIDLSPADDIFFHGHLLPLQFLSHLPISPRSSTNSLDSFTLPIRDLVDDQEPTKESNNCSTSIGSNNIINKKKSNSSSNIQESKSRNGETRGRTKSKSFSIFGLPKRRKDCEEREDKEGKHKRKMRFDVSNILKRYVRMVRPLLFFRGRKENVHFSRQPYSFSGNLSPRNKHHLRGRRGEFSAPASMRTSPTNSGLLLATSGATTPTNTSDSTMEELQAAIQAAIAHCKNSIATEEKIKCVE
ncbi:hypothetical protein RchiOBHm_Chr6g0307761 [Rosa chinensis]|uniref:BRI1 kinase inhibitor 1 n=1 Tax=Rosa chinensis TaxID=74649 RepID=A0A2P6Q0E8_ROSCH|nr:BRI1 kinase inhibitor 1 [Rosa chinensis]PRQ27670.1 hypothetical protein RchiOBHm_Chr6g0307761 [Rosa chinensis]